MRIHTILSSSSVRMTSAIQLSELAPFWLSANRLPRLQRAVPSVSLDKSEYLIAKFISQKIFVDKQLSVIDRPARRAADRVV
jgi:hypothetical protein